MKRHLENVTVYRLYTEDKNREDTVKLVSIMFDNFNFFTGTASWHGKLEDTIIFEIVDDGQDKYCMSISIAVLAKQIGRLNNQEEILVTNHTLNLVEFHGIGLSED